MEPKFTGPSFTLGIEEELMILDSETLALANAIEAVLEEHGEDETSSPSCSSRCSRSRPRRTRTRAAAGEQLRALRPRGRRGGQAARPVIGSAGTHPFAMWEDQRVSSRPRYRELIAALRFVARQEIIFGLHVHVGIDDPEKAIHVANGMRVHVPILLALGANSPYWRADDTGLASTRMPIFRAFPRVGIPPYYEDWADYERRIGFMVDSGVIEDYTYLWYDVRPHPNFGTVEIRAMDAQTRVEHTLALAALIQAMVKELAEHYEAGKQLARYPYEMLDENKWLAARHGLEGELVDLPERRMVPAKELARRLYDRLREHAQDLGSAERARGDHGHPAPRERRAAPAGRLRGEPRLRRGDERDRGGH